MALNHVLDIEAVILSDQINLLKTEKVRLEKEKIELEERTELLWARIV
ncbi:unnamed protein product [Oikopleura dioica]|uniref:Uncharacterized protein n=1 Tax=Oikopleura dioica TaxID=34765 RepID=E4Y4H5_OIKDI|nr:unnamed protein product [Oikopleura dioica]